MPSWQARTTRDASSGIVPGSRRCGKSNTRFWPQSRHIGNCPTTKELKPLPVLRPPAGGAPHNWLVKVRPTGSPRLEPLQPSPRGEGDPANRDRMRGLAQTLNRQGGLPVLRPPQEAPRTISRSTFRLPVARRRRRPTFDIPLSATCGDVKSPLGTFLPTGRKNRIAPS